MKYYALRTASSQTKGAEARIFLLVDLRGFFSDLGSTGRKQINKKALKMTSQLVIFRAFFFFFFFFLISPEKTVKLVRQTNSMYKFFKYFIIFLKIWTGQSLFTVSLSKIHRQNLKKILFFSTKQIIFRVGG